MLRALTLQTSEDVILQLEKGVLCFRFRHLIARDRDVYYTAGRYVRWQKNGRKFYLCYRSACSRSKQRGEWPLQPIHFSLTSLLSWVKSTATPASTLPTVREINMLEYRVCCGWRMEICLPSRSRSLELSRHFSARLSTTVSPHFQGTVVHI